MNECTPALFQLAPDAAGMAAADVADIQACIRSLGLAPTKAKNLKAMSQVGWRGDGAEVGQMGQGSRTVPSVVGRLCSGWDYGSTCQLMSKCCPTHPALPVPQMLLAEHGGEVPASMAALEALPGVGHKTASVVMCQAFAQDAFPVDTHIHVRPACALAPAPACLPSSLPACLPRPWSLAARRPQPCGRVTECTRCRRF